MVSFDTAASISLLVVLTLAVFLNRKKLSFHRFGPFYAAMYRTQAGVATMDKLGKKYKNFLVKATPWIIGMGFIGMAVVVFDLARSLITILVNNSAPAVGVVLPIQAKGVFYVPFLYWIISIFAILIIHEGMHGVMARAYNLPVKNSGLVVLGALVPLIPGAFVEPDEKKLVAAERKKQLAVYAAGPVANIVTGLLLLAFSMLIITPVTNTFYSNDGVIITDLMDGNPPAEQAGLDVGEKIVTIDGSAITGTADFSDAITSKEPGDTINVITTHATYDVELGENPQTKKAWFGVFVENPLKAPTWATYIVLWLKDLVFWLYVLSLGVGLFNLVPLGPIDGGRMFLTALEHYTHTTRASAIWKATSFAVLGILLTNIVLAFV